MNSATRGALSSGSTSLSGGGNNDGCSIGVSIPVASGSFNNGSSWHTSIGGGYSGSYSGNGSYGASVGICMRF